MAWVRDRWLTRFRESFQAPTHAFRSSLPSATSIAFQYHEAPTGSEAYRFIKVGNIIHHMSRRLFLKTSAVIGAGAVTGAGFARQKAPRSATARPIRVVMGGYAPPSNGFSLSLKRIGDHIQSKFGKDVDIKYIYNILDLGYKGEDLPWLVEDGILTMAYQSSSYFTGQIPDLGIADLPFLFSDAAKARAAMDGRFGSTLVQRMEAKANYRILGWFENGFRHISNRLRPIHTPADLKGMTIRVLPSKVQERTFELLGATPRVMDLSELLPAIKAGSSTRRRIRFRTRRLTACTSTTSSTLRRTTSISRVQSSSTACRLTLGRKTCSRRCAWLCAVPLSSNERCMSRKKKTRWRRFGKRAARSSNSRPTNIRRLSMP